jgi:putative ABC transport system substrate-binding protein
MVPSTAGRRRFVFGVALGLLAAAGAAHTQPAGKVPTIGYLVLPPLTPTPSTERAAFLQGLAGLGYVDGRTIKIEYRSAAWNRELLAELADDLVRLRVDLIVAPGLPAAQAARSATSVIPVVATAVADPIGGGLATSLARPGGNVTGLTMLSSELASKRLELLKEAVGRVRQIAVLWNRHNPAARLEWETTESAGRALAVTTQSFPVGNAEELLTAFAAIAKARPSALLTILDPLTASYRQIVAEFALKHQLPALLALREFAEDGGLMSYGPSLPDLFRRAAIYVDKVLRGVRPADLPFEQPATFELVVNLKTARALGLTIPQSVLLRADEIIQ